MFPKPGPLPMRPEASLRPCIEMLCKLIVTTTERAICGAPNLNSVAHPQVCLVRHRILATKIISVAHLGRAPQKVQLSVAHPESCATEIARQDPYAEEFCGALSLMRHRKWCATKKTRVRHRNMKQKYMYFFILLYKYRYIQDLYRFMQKYRYI